ncbi:hypothetical protein QO002_001496 [Pararhizobium capsulatum DSM 1112]|uniref:HdeA/HdeB family protein n=1 Tax=Pararhizobium capsulatum DSM 1112 TaxID=1121113 RepID=A0ABU0BN65_9HYPH|nr:hypothetical protein [Pararhizobium capsulatum]MDQ0319358.1 hypothetical protein [Pararhizobium capsulatum DSM 1112]
MIFALMLTALMTTAEMPTAEPTAEALQSDLQTAYACQDIDGRKVWKGGLAYYIQSFVYDGETPEAGSDVATDAVLPGDNTPETMEEFEQACITIAPAQANSN